MAHPTKKQDDAVSKAERSPRRERRGTEPDDAHRGWIAPIPHDADEAMADREMADAERAVAQGSPDDDLAARVGSLEGARTHEERRDRWMHR